MLFKRITALLLTLCLLVGFVPAQAFAAEDPEVGVDNSDVTLESTNTLGSLLTEEITEEGTLTTVSDDYDAGYSVTNVEVTGSTAVATYESLEDAILVVALYSEDGMQLLNTAKTEVTADATTATVEFTGEMPEFFIVSAYLLDVYDYSPLCSSFETPLYTQDMQELLAMTAEDCMDEYGEDRVYNLDESNETNFAVYAEGTILLQETAGVNTVASADDETLTYVFENADEQITGLAQGDVVVYELSNDLLIFKVASVSVEGTTATVTGADLEIEEVFALMKLENTADGSDASIDTSDMDEDLTYTGTSSGGSTTYSSRIDVENTGASTQDWEGGGTNQHVFNFTLAKTPEDFLGGNGSLSANLKLYLHVTLNFYVSTKRQFVELKIQPGINIGITFKGELPLEQMKLPSFDIALCPGIFAHLSPQLKISLAGEAKLNADIHFVLGGSLEHRRGGHWTYNDLSESPEVDFNAEVEAKIFIGFDLHPSVTVLSKYVAEAALEATVGLEIKGTLYYGTADDPDPKDIQHHDCTSCVDGDIGVVLDVSLKVKFLNTEKLTMEKNLKDVTWKLGDFYCSFDYGDLGWGECPHYRYKVVLRALKDDMTPAANVAVKLSNGTELGKTNKNGIIDTNFLSPGYYTFTATIDGQPVTYTTRVYTYSTVVLTASKEYWERQEQLKRLRITPDDVSASSVYKSGTCGDAAKWTLYASGVLEITGEGAMDNYSSASQQPWYKWQDKIKSIRIGDRITSVGNYAFAECTSVTKVIIEDSVTQVGYYSFYGCSGINTIKMPVDLDINATTEKINLAGDVRYHSSFTGCNNVKSIYYTYGKTGDMNQRDNTNSSYSYANYYSLEYINTGTLESVTFGSGIAFIISGAFSNAKKLSTVTFYGDAPSFGSNCFYGVTATVLYPQRNTTWTESVFQNYGGTMTWTAYTLNEDGSINTGAEEEEPEATEPTEPEATEPEATEPEATEPEATEPETTEETEATEATEAAATGIVTVEIPGAAAAGFRMGASSGSKVRTASTGAPTVNSSPIGGNKVEGKPDTDATPDAVYPGINDSEESEDQVMLQTTSFSGLVAGKEYVLLALVSLEAEDLLAHENILFIDQAAAAEDGTLVFTYIQRESTDTFYVFACGAAHKDLADAVITFPEVYTNNEARYVSPEVVYDGEVLIEGVDYVIVEGAVVTEAGEYTCTIRGICNYTGLVTCTYTVGEYVSAQFTGSTVTLADSLTMYFAMNTAELTGEDNYAQISRTNADGTTETVTVPQADWIAYAEDMMLVPFTDIAAKEMTDAFTVVICDASGEVISNRWDDSIRSYATRMLSQRDVIADAELRSVYVDMLNYGAAAQSHFGYGTDDLANAELTDTQKSYATAACATESNLQCSFGRAGTALTLKNRITLDLFFKNSVIGSDYTGLYAVACYTDHYGNEIETRIDTVNPYGESYGYVSVPGLAIADYAQEVTCTVYDAEGNALAWVTDSIEGYAHRMSGKLPAMVDAIVKFGYSAYQYFH